MASKVAPDPDKEHGASMKRSFTAESLAPEVDEREEEEEEEEEQTLVLRDLLQVRAAFVLPRFDSQAAVQGVPIRLSQRASGYTHVNVSSLITPGKRV